eukprot:13623-Heterococcus_DN1.PRE.5
MTALHQVHVMVCSSQWSAVRIALNCTKLCVASVSQHYFSNFHIKDRLSAAGLYAQFVVIAGTAPRDGRTAQELCYSSAAYCSDAVVDILKPSAHTTALAISASMSCSSTAAVFHMRTDRMAALAYNSTAKTLCTYTTLAATMCYAKCTYKQMYARRCIRSSRQHSTSVSANGSLATEITNMQYGSSLADFDSSVDVHLFR